MDRITIPKIRPASWKVYVQGEEQAHYVCRVLEEAGIDTTEPDIEPGLNYPPLYGFVAAPKADVSLTEEELLAILGRDERLELVFASA
jgi:hypothetical protein